MDERRFRIEVPGSGSVGAVATGGGEPDAAYVFAHGAGAGMDHVFMQRVAAGLADRRIATLRFQFPYSEAGRHRVDAPAVAQATVRAVVGQANQLWPLTPLFAGGKSFGGRMASQAQALEPLAGVLGLVFLGFPLHPAGKPSLDRAPHLFDIGVPMLFVQGTRDALAEAPQHAALLQRLGAAATRADIDGADHSFSVLRRSGRTDAQALDEALDWILVWTQAVTCAARDTAA
ncbi:alpha/beta family hydrolase [Pseudorhodoferax sp. Leaf274]|uniref:alpha/beta hydrolase family protein n=1 Tax=Pseudorhodoferax sp. Leaf274 TaxID=1736318 RepID=UPI000702F7FE|nr:alpha/beta family hydrolase [Pseudorhodoferax sp. Leaf274]KQP35413.1 alpha/beta hydrolase [Pseudorhodoferax sp. Leaf274]